MLWSLLMYVMICVGKDLGESFNRMLIDDLVVSIQILATQFASCHGWHLLFFPRNESCITLSSSVVARSLELLVLLCCGSRRGR